MLPDDAGLPGRHRRTGRHRPQLPAASARRGARHRSPQRLTVPAARGGITVALAAALAVSTTAGSGIAGDGAVRPLSQRTALVQLAEPAQQAVQAPAARAALRSARTVTATAREAARVARQATLARSTSMDTTIDLVKQGGERVRAAAQAAERRAGEQGGASRAGERGVAAEAQVEQVAAPAPQYARPVTGRLTSGYGYRWGRLHQGIDYGAPYGASVRSVVTGTVEVTGWSGGLGYQVRVRADDGALLVYGHLSRVGVSSGQRVAAGQWIGAVGNSGRSTGPHLHLEVHVDGVAVDPIPWLAARGIAP